MPLSSARDRLAMRFTLVLLFKLSEANNMTSFKKGLKTCAALLGAAIWAAMVWGMAYTGLLFVTFEGAVWLNQIMGYGMILISFCMTTLLFLIAWEARP